MCVSVTVCVVLMGESVPRQDVPGASLAGRDPSDLKVPELKRWLECRAASTRGKKADLIAR